jgi:hypothetical protein
MRDEFCGFDSPDGFDRLFRVVGMHRRRSDHWIDWPASDFVAHFLGRSTVRARSW